MPVIKAIQITTAIPIIYNKVLFNDKYYVDGALIEDFPIQLFRESKQQTLGFLIKSKQESTREIKDIITYFNRIVNCIQLRLKEYQTI